MEDSSYRQWPFFRKLSAAAPLPEKDRQSRESSRLRITEMGRQGRLFKAEARQIFKENSDLPEEARRCEGRYGRPATPRQPPWPAILNRPLTPLRYAPPKESKERRPA